MDQIITAPDKRVDLVIVNDARRYFISFIYVEFVEISSAREAVTYLPLFILCMPVTGEYFRPLVRWEVDEKSSIKFYQTYIHKQKEAVLTPNRSDITCPLPQTSERVYHPCLLVLCRASKL